jgi:Domain of unknown function DUF1828
MMSCENLLNRMGYECHEADGKTIIVDTPFAFADGESIGFYLRDDRDVTVIHDNADTLAHLRGVGMNLTSRLQWKGIRNIVAAFGFELEDSGIISGRMSRDREAELIKNYISALLAISDLEREYLGLSEEQSQYVQEVEFYLRASKPNAVFESAPFVHGHSGKNYRFHFSFDGWLVDAARPNGNRTGAILRKSLDVKNAADHQIMVVMDDREEPDRAKSETDILSTTVSVLQFTALARRSSGSTAN